MLKPFEVIGAGRPEFEMGVDAPAFDWGEKATFENPSDATVKQAVLGIFAGLPDEVLPILTKVAMELVRNAQAYAAPTPSAIRTHASVYTLILGWTMDGGYRYPLIMVGDRNPAMPVVRESTRTGLKRVIGDTYRCGAAGTQSGKWVWGLVDPQKR
ncbi:hypothetical protein [Actinomadura coerulea]|uniref:hypothetical protein n=1 Tax=Actinomadura coerulea TaxID=46159 RepID=UPI00344A87D1